MATTAVDVRELPERFAELVALVAAGGEVIVTQGTVPRARLVSLAPSEGRRAGLHPGAITTSPDFDDPLPNDVLTSRP